MGSARRGERGQRGWGCRQRLPHQLFRLPQPHISPLLFIRSAFMQIKQVQALPAAAARAVPAPWHTAPVATSPALGTPRALAAKHVTLGGKKRQPWMHLSPASPLASSPGDAGADSVQRWTPRGACRQGWWPVAAPCCGGS